ncbi:hypothetical protein GALL_456690 [mine drainage metagenome]|uniref:Uncharacterized protein n=1 Tax=mine drainage metagenome TaxID=410659 RepID=A0A1J5Q5G1_9ZZZZ
MSFIIQAEAAVATATRTIAVIASAYQTACLRKLSVSRRQSSLRSILARNLPNIQGSLLTRDSAQP